MSASVNYLIITDAFATLQFNGQKAAAFGFDRGLQLNPQIRPILVWKANFKGDTVADLAYTVSLNGTVIHQDAVSKKDIGKRSVHEMIAGDKLLPGQNRIKFEVIGGQGTLKISDVYLMYHQV